MNQVVPLLKVIINKGGKNEDTFKEGKTNSSISNKQKIHYINKNKCYYVSADNKVFENSKIKNSKI